MKRILLVLALVCLATAAFASDLSVGVGASGSYYSSDFKVSGGGSTSDSVATAIPFNFMAYVDITYLQVAVGYRMVDGFHIKTDSGSSDDKSKYSYVSFAGYGKFPLQLGSITLIPMVGIEYDLTISATDDSGNEANSSQRSDLNSLWIKGGLGAEISITPEVYIRPELLLGYQLNNQSERDAIDYIKSLGASDASILTLNFELAVLLGVRL